MRIIHLEAENILNLRAVSFSPDGRVVRVTGKNGAGKTSLLNAIFYALAGKKGHAEKPIRRGADKATVRVALGRDEVELTVALRITDKGAYIDVESPEGARFRSPQAMLDAMIGALTFDPQAFSRMPADDRLETLRQLVNPGVNFDAIDRQNQADYQLRTEWNRKLRSLTERATALRADVDASLSIDPVDVSALTQQMAKAAEHNATIAQLRATRERMARSIGERKDRAEALRQQAQALLAEAAEHEKRAAVEHDALVNAMPLADPIDVTALREQIDAAAMDNRVRDSQRRVREELARLERDREEASAAAAGLTKRIDQRDADKQAAIAAVKMPIEGLGFGDGDVTFNGLPFDQASTGEQLRIATAIGMALNPKLRVLCVRDGSLLDEDSLAILEAMANEHDFQVWIEATQSKPTVGVHIVDGSIAAIDGVPVEQPELLAEVGD